MYKVQDTEVLLEEIKATSPKYILQLDNSNIYTRVVFSHVLIYYITQHENCIYSIILSVYRLPSAFVTEDLAWRLHAGRQGK